MAIHLMKSLRNLEDLCSGQCMIKPLALVRLRLGYKGEDSAWKAIIIDLQEKSFFPDGNMSSGKCIGVLGD